MSWEPAALLRRYIGGRAAKRSPPLWEFYHPRLARPTCYFSAEAVPLAPISASAKNKGHVDKR
jgi:hypothetical protein